MKVKKAVMTDAAEEEEVSTSTTTAPIVLHQLQRWHTNCHWPIGRLRIGVDPRTQIGLQDEAGPSSSNLPQYAAPQNQAGTHKLVEVPIGIESVKLYRKALMFLHEYQHRRRSIEWVSLKNCKELKSLLKQFEHRLVYDQVRTYADRAAHCVIRDSYKPGQLIRMLKAL
ncbi:hypothetical protein [Parasitella parasitica]|uniref:Uncharacterized protein n=1 Tax=Parasitella parasitica TaxID=35722 RepID=A0A0B7N3F6_9FUNG|nr:hypothetical protein [Parasitella parasitica]